MQTELKRIFKFGGIFALVMILGTSFFAYKRTTALVESNLLMPGTEQAVDAIDDVLADLQAGSAAAEGFLLSGDEAHRQRFEKAELASRDDLIRVRKLSSVSPEQRSRIESLDKKVDDCFDRWTTDMARGGGAGKTPDLARTDAEIESARDLVNAMNDEEFRQMQKRTQVVQRNAVTAMLALLGLTLCAVAVAAWVFVFEERTYQISFLNEVSSTLQICITSEEAHEAVATFMQRLFPGSSGSLALISNSRDALDTACEWGTVDFEKTFTPDECYALRTGRPYLYGSSAGRIACKHLTAPLSTPYICIPMMAQGESLGILHVQHASLAGLTDSLGGRQKVLANVSEHFAMALANLRLRETLKNQSIRDPLTGLFNRRYMETTLEREARRTARNKSNMAVMMADLDHFKHFNDTFGHDAGDVLLREAAACLRKAVRAEDIVCRYGGEEFTIVLLDTAQAQALERASTMVESIRAMNVQLRGQPLGRVTISIGLAMFPEHSESTSELLSVADKALYKAKSDGRDRVVVYSAPRLALASDASRAAS